MERKKGFCGFSGNILNSGFSSDRGEIVSPHTAIFNTATRS